MKDWYLRQTPRDRLIVIIVSGLVIVGLLYAFAWYPLQEKLTRTARAIDNKQETLAFVRQGAARIKASSGAGGSQLRDAGGLAPYSLIDQRIRAAGLAKPDRVEPSGQNGARITFSEVAFDELVIVLAELELYGLRVTNMNITRKDKPKQTDTGLVSARFNMERG